VSLTDTRSESGFSDTEGETDSRKSLPVGYRGHASSDAPPQNAKRAQIDRRSYSSKEQVTWDLEEDIGYLVVRHATSRVVSLTKKTSNTIEYWVDVRLKSFSRPPVLAFLTSAWCLICVCAKLTQYWPDQGRTGCTRPRWSG